MRFTSDRERRLWILVVVTIVAIYATLGVARNVFEFLRERDLLRPAFAALIVAAVVAIAWPWLRRLPGPREVGTAFAVSGVYLMVAARVQDANWAERTHLFEYAVVAILVYRAFEERHRNHGRPAAPALAAAALATLLGWLDEVLQWLLPSRVYDWEDVLFNTVAVTVAIGGRRLVVWARHRDRQPMEP